MLIRVVLPEPFGPIRIVSDSSSTPNETSSTARRLPKSFDTFLTSRAEPMRITKKGKGCGTPQVEGCMPGSQVTVPEIADHEPLRYQFSPAFGDMTVQIW